MRKSPCFCRRLMLARDISAEHKGATFVADVKSTGLFMTDPVLRENGIKVDYWKTGHSYMKRRVNEIGAMAGFSPLRMRPV
jgi:phosphomannomutase / phosphoglucomutase